MRHIKIELLVIGASIVLSVIVACSWLSTKNEQEKLQSTLATQQKVISDADARETQRSESLKQEIEEITRLKQAIRTPKQVLAELPKYLSLPQPIRRPTNTTSSHGGLLVASSSFSAGVETEMGRPNIKDSSLMPVNFSAGAEIPTADLKPLFDFTQDCRACETQLISMKQEIVDDHARFAAMTKERDVAVNVARGGSIWRRVRHNAAWFAAGGAICYAMTHR